MTFNDWAAKTGQRPPLPVFTEGGGPAFPSRDVNDDTPAVFYRGLTVRDYFAAKAMQAYITAIVQRDEPISDREIARWSYVNADAMLAERQTDGAQ